jgi:uncharacterized Tic20 family protein
MEQISQHATVDSGLQTMSPSYSERQWAASAHFAALLLAMLTTWIAGAAGVVGAGTVYLLKRDDSSFVAEHAKEAINFNLSMFIYSGIAFVIGMLLVGATVLTLGIGLILTLPAGIVLVLACTAIAILWLVCSVIATMKAWNGERYRYPLSLRLLK